MVPPMTGWTGAAAVNGLMAIVLLVWLADGTTRSSVSEHPATAPAAKQASEAPPARPIKAPASIDLPPPPRSAPAARRGGGPSGVIHRVSPMRPPAHGGIEPPIEIVPIQVAEVERRPMNPPIRTPLRPVEKPASVSNPVIAETPDRSAPASCRSSVAGYRGDVHVGRSCQARRSRSRGPRRVRIFVAAHARSAPPRHRS